MLPISGTVALVCSITKTMFAVSIKLFYKGQNFRKSALKLR